MAGDPPGVTWGLPPDIWDPLSRTPPQDTAVLPPPRSPLGAVTGSDSAAPSGGDTTRHGWGMSPSPSPFPSPPPPRHSETPPGLGGHPGFPPHPMDLGNPSFRPPERL